MYFYKLAAQCGSRLRWRIWNQPAQGEWSDASRFLAFHEHQRNPPSRAWADVPVLLPCGKSPHRRRDGAAD